MVRSKSGFRYFDLGAARGTFFVANGLTGNIRTPCVHTETWSFLNVFEVKQND